MSATDYARRIRTLHMLASTALTAEQASLYAARVELAIRSMLRSVR